MRSVLIAVHDGKTAAIQHVTVSPVVESSVCMCLSLCDGIRAAPSEQFVTILDYFRVYSGIGYSSRY